MKLVHWLETPMTVSYGQVLMAGFVLLVLIGFAGWLALCWREECTTVSDLRKLLEFNDNLILSITQRLRACDELLLRRANSREEQPPH